MMVLQINTVYNRGSTGNIAKGIHDICANEGIHCLTAYRYSEEKAEPLQDTMEVSSWLDCHVHNRLVRYTHLQGFYSHVKTRRFIKVIKKDKLPDIIHLHNLHGSYINLKLLFRFIKKYDIHVIWTLHDCWTFTGHCPYFTLVKCEKWKTGCHHCPSYREYPSSLIDNSKFMYCKKKEWFTGVKDLTIVTPSQWLADLVRQSFLKEYPVRVIHNGIDLAVFKPTESNFREKYNIPQTKKLLLGVAFGWGVRKGLDVFIELAKRLDKEQYQIVLVGTDETVDKQLPPSIISIHRTQNQKELAEIYTAADLFVNPTREEVLGLVNLESLACGTPVLTFRTGGSPECIDDTCGSVVEWDDIDAMEREIIRICEQAPYTKEACMERAKKFDQKERFKDYIALYREIEDKK